MKKQILTTLVLMAALAAYAQTNTTFQVAGAATQMIPPFPGPTGPPSPRPPGPPIIPQAR